MPDSPFFSVVIAVREADVHVAEAVQSLVNQTIGFEKSIQVVLVRAGGVDGGDACRRLQVCYPKNIEFVATASEGLDDARNEGLKHVRGAYVNFLDAADQWERHAFARVRRFIQKTGAKTVSTGVRYLGCRNRRRHSLDYGNVSAQVMDIAKKTGCPQWVASRMFFRAELVRHRTFEPAFQNVADFKFITDVLLDEPSCGILPNAMYLWRDRPADLAAMAAGASPKPPDFGAMQRVAENLFSASQARFGKVLGYVQNAVMGDLRRRLETDVSGTLTGEELAEYKKSIASLLRWMDDGVILSKKGLSWLYKTHALSLKYGRDILPDLVLDRRTAVYTFHGLDVVKLGTTGHVIVNILEAEGKTVRMEGRLDLGVDGKLGRIALRKNGQILELERYGLWHREIRAFDGEKLHEGTAFRVQVPVRPGDRLDFVFLPTEGASVELIPDFREYAKVTRRVAYSYYQTPHLALVRRRGVLYVGRNGALRRFGRELRYQLFLCATMAWRTLKHFRRKDKALLGAVAVCAWRTLGLLRRKFQRKETWILSDRSHVAGDNGEALFKYLAARGVEADVYFVIDGHVPDYRRMKRYGKVLRLGSFAYRLKFLTADKIVSSQASDWETNAFGSWGEYLKDLYVFDFCYLRHGIAKNDQSAWLCKQKKNIKMFVTSIRGEYESVLSGAYGYDAREVKLTGLARYDYLEDRALKKVVFLATWRHNLVGGLLPGTSERAYAESFRGSEYCRFFNALINDSRLLGTMRAHGYTGDFYVHPTLEKQAVDFQGNETIQVHREVADYPKVFAEGALLVTDYSSVVFDFGYLKKPMVYAQFDRQSIYEQQGYAEGDYHDEGDGFGPVVYDYEGAVSSIVAYIENGCRMEEKYVRRVESFFAYTDKRNCERVYDAIRALRG